MPEMVTISVEVAERALEAFKIGTEEERASFVAMLDDEFRRAFEYVVGEDEDAQA